MGVHFWRERHDYRTGRTIMGQKFEKYISPTKSFQPSGTTDHVQGTLLQVDVVGREIVVLLPKGMAVFDVPPDCLVRLRGEPIKLRLIQPRDRVRIAFDDHQGRLIAHLLEVQPDPRL